MPIGSVVIELQYQYKLRRIQEITVAKEVGDWTPFWEPSANGVKGITENGFKVSIEHFF